MSSFTKRIQKMTTEEKASFIVSASYWSTRSIPDSDIREMNYANGSHGYSEMQDHFAYGARLNIQDKEACFPCAAALGASWDRKLLKLVGQAIAEEAREGHIDILLAPNLGVKRSSLYGRNFDLYSEDPLLCAELGIQFIDGVQSRGIAACPKYVADNLIENKRVNTELIADARALNEIYLRPFEKAVKQAKPWALLLAANALNGEYAAQNRDLISKIKNEWEFDGALISDFFAVRDLTSSTAAGTDLVLASRHGFDASQLTQAVKNGTLEESRLNDAVESLLQLQSRIDKSQYALTLSDRHVDANIAKKAARESMVLLKNEDQILPLKKNIKLAVIGPFAQNPRIQGAGSEYVGAALTSSPWSEISKYAPRVVFAEGYSFEPKQAETGLKEEAEAAAKDADIVILFLGLTDRTESEGTDRAALELPENQIQLLGTLAKHNENIVAVLTNGGPVTMPWLDKVKAVLETYLPGEGGGEAIAGILYGKYNPCAKLAETFPVCLEDTPSYFYFHNKDNRTEFRESIYNGYRYYQKVEKQTLFPFGFGLSYTSFEYSAMTAAPAENGEKISIEVTVQNTGGCAGSEIVQIYGEEAEPKIFKAKKELLAFDKIYLRANQAKTVRFELDNANFRFYDSEHMEWRISPGKYMIHAAASSEDIRISKHITIFQGTATEPYHGAKEIPAYYAPNPAKLALPHLEFETLLGYRISQPAQKALDLNMLLSEFNATLTGEVLYPYLSRVLFPDKQNETQIYAHKITDEQKTEYIGNLTLLNLITIAGGQFTHEIAQQALRALNGDKESLKNIKKLLQNSPVKMKDVR